MGKLSLGAILFAAFGALAHAQTQQELLRDGNGGSTDNVLTYGMGYHQQRYSPLKQISKSTVRRLVPVWSASLANEFGEQGQPLVYNGVLYTANVKRVVASTSPPASSYGRRRSNGSRRLRAWCAAASPTEGWRSTTASCSSARSTHT